MDKSIIIMLAIAGGGILAYKFLLKPKIQQVQTEQKALPKTEEDAKMQVLQTKIATYKEDAQQKWDEFISKRTS